jgi:hypothetical protein
MKISLCALYVFWWRFKKYAIEYSISTGFYSEYIRNSVFALF